MLQEKVDRIASILPHGSGINYDYKIRVAVPGCMYRIAMM